MRSLNYMHTGHSKSLTPVLYKGYERVYLYKGDTASRKRQTVHRMVAEAFIPNPENKPQINHDDGNKTNNHWRNLFWATQAENAEHACRVLGKTPATGALSKCAKTYLVELRNGSRITITGLNAFCDLHGLDRSAMVRTSKGKQRKHKGYRVIKQLRRSKQ